jgi:glycosyltransferase involved in cell wall biosynthesis
MKVSVIIPTYNHSQFISQALESVVAQRADFTFEIIVSEDCSTDGTRKIVLDWRARYPDLIRLILSEQNVHSNEVVARAFRAAKGTYIALLDGDDFWTCPDKLQLQVDFLDHNPQCSMCCHKVEIANEHGVESPPRYWSPDSLKAETTLEDILQGNFIATCSTMFRNGVVPDIPHWYAALFPITDWPLYVIYAQHGTIGYIDRSMGAYRLHAGGWFSPLAAAEKLDSTSRFYKAINANFDASYAQLVREATYRFFFDWAVEYHRRGDNRLARKCFWNSVALGFPNGIRQMIEASKFAVKLYVPFARAWLGPERV